MFNSLESIKIIRGEFKSGKDNESLLYNFLEELIILFDEKQFFLFGVEKIEIKNGKLRAEVVGDKAENYKISLDVKAITYSEMFVKQEKDKWVSQVVLDV